MKVKATYFQTKVGDPNNPTLAHFLNVPQCHGHSEKEIQVSEDTVKDMNPGDTLEVDTNDLPYLRAIPKGLQVEQKRQAQLDQASKDAQEALQIGKQNADKLDQILAKLK